ncbi:MAG: DEAD/DEAH box helicase [Gammaproteobacteria bacterium]|nr:DEAD/DEAH box helicase [Gammaproteobacteria bacterium]MBU1654394.1 DEAD/DEAH box helicase [Gammaproteobacteria bacterium]MBU1960235.1 DEAD/DEAH box helicase [Gammaproteobacteria bacterium]
MTLDDLRTQFSARDFWLAEQIYDHGGTGVTGLTANGERIFGVVHDKGRPQRVIADRPGNKDGMVRGECSCRAKGGCAHLCALLMQYLAEQKAARRKDSRTASPPPASEQRALIYEIQPEAGGCRVIPKVALTLSQQGRWERSLPYTFDPNARPPRFLQPEDPGLLARLASLGRRLGAAQGDLLGRLLDTGRCFLPDQGQPLRKAPPKEPALDWHTDGQGIQHARWSTPDGGELLLPLPWYLDRTGNACGPIRSGWPQALLDRLAMLPPVSPHQTESLRAELTELAVGASIPLPQIHPIVPIQGVRPIPLLRIGLDEDHSILCRLLFDYQGCLLVEDGRRDCFRDGRLLRIERDLAFERQCASRFPPPDVGRKQSTLAYKFTQIEWIEEGAGYRIADLDQAGWRLEYEPGFAERIKRPDAWFGEIEPAGEGWFDLTVGIAVAGERINLVPLLQALIRDDERVASPQRFTELPNDAIFYIPHGNGRLALTAARLRPLLATLFELYQDKPTPEGRLRMSRTRAAAHRAEFAADEESGIAWREPPAIRELCDSLRRTKGLQATATPEGLTVKLRDYQHEGLSWLQFLGRHGVGAILADDMGLGKTLQALAYLLSEKEQGHLAQPALVVAPTSLLPNWRAEARRFAPDLSVLVLHGPQRKELFPEIPAHDLIVTSYPLLARDWEELGQYAFSTLILDEAQWIKNPQSQTGVAARAIQAENRICLTGTPLENHLGELWSLFDFLMPGFLGSQGLFRRRVRDPVEKWGDDDMARRLARRIRPFLLRRTKEQVLAELPPKTEIERPLSLEGDQRDLYETVRAALHQRVREELAEKGLGRSRIVVLEALLKLRQVCCDPRLVKLEEARRVRQSAKLEYLTQLLPELIEEGRRILLFSQFTGMLALIEQEVARLGIGHVKLTGQTKDRQTPIQQFQQGDVPLFLISLKAGGVGLNLTAADTVIHYDPWWNPAVERQASDRAHRIGQEKPVFVYKLICEGTVETRIRDLQARKQALADNLFDAAGVASPQWDESDLDVLFAPLEEM